MCIRDRLYGLLLTFGLALVIEGLFRNYYGASGQPYNCLLYTSRCV